MLPIVRFQALDVGERVTQKIVLRAAKERSLIDPTIQLRAIVVEGGNVKAAEEWTRTTWMPHVSLLYANKNVTEDERLQAMKLINENGVHFDGDKDELKDPACAQWKGGRILWVDTRGEITSWRVLGERDLEFHVI